MRLRFVAIVALLLSFAGASQAQSPADKAAIVAMMNKSADDWNKGDLDAFASCYKKSPEILFMGRKINKGYDGMLAAYKAGYGNKEKMGTLSFTDLETQPLDAKFATATGWFHLKRSAEGGGDSQGYFLLVLEKTRAGWKIVRDDTTDVPMTKK